MCFACVIYVSIVLVQFLGFALTLYWIVGLGSRFSHCIHCLVALVLLYPLSVSVLLRCVIIPESYTKRQTVLMYEKATLPPVRPQQTNCTFLVGFFFIVSFYCGNHDSEKNMFVVVLRAHRLTLSLCPYLLFLSVFSFYPEENLASISFLVLLSFLLLQSFSTRNYTGFTLLHTHAHAQTWTRNLTQTHTRSSDLDRTLSLLP